MSVPDDIREELRKRLWVLADRAGWMNLSSGAKARYYENWTRDASIGGVLSRFVDKGQVRVYLKDTLLKGYSRSKLADECRPLRVLRIPASTETVETYVKPHGRRLKDGRVICWGRAVDWKSVLMALHERAYVNVGSKPFGAVLTYASGRFHEEATRRMVQDAATRLGVEHLIWLDT